MHRATAPLTLATAGAALALVAGCGTAKTDVSAGVNDFNKELAPEGLALDCPKEVTGGEGTVFDCTMKGTKNGKSAPVQLKVVKQGGDLVVDAADRTAYDQVRQKVAGG